MQANAIEEALLQSSLNNLSIVPLGYDVFVTTLSSANPFNFYFFMLPFI